MSKLVFGVGYNDLDSGAHSNPFYVKWKEMLRRCYSENFLTKRPSYRGTVVCEEWLTFSNFKAWMEKQDWEGKELDKDILGCGNKYSPDTCVFVPKVVNGFLSGTTRQIGEFKVGVSFHKKAGKFTAKVKNPITKVRENLGLFNTEDEAHKAWKSRKLEIALLLTSGLEEEVISAVCSKFL